MRCSDNEAHINVTIPVVMLSKLDGDPLQKSIADGRKVELLLYSAKSPIVDPSVAFLWLMSVGTIVCASLWPKITASEESDDRYNDLSPKGSPNTAKEEDEHVDINVMSAVLFVFSASTFLVLLYFFMSSWFIWLLIVLFCLGGIEQMEKLRAEDSEIATCGQGYHSYSCSVGVLRGICCFMGIKSEVGLFLDWSRYSLIAMVTVGRVVSRSLLEVMILLFMAFDCFRNLFNEGLSLIFFSVVFGQ
ncbi:hypothetical protein LguiB_013109 [Lonicera macranthoides]